MQCIATALDKAWAKRASDICGELRALGLKEMRAADRPRFVYLMAERFEARRMELALAGVAAGTKPFTFSAADLGMFRSGAETIVYASIAPNDQLRHMHRLVWDATLRVASGKLPAYAPETWVPHVALAAGPIPEPSIADATSLLARHDASEWSIKVNNVCYVPDIADPEVDWLRFDVR